MRIKPHYRKLIWTDLIAGSERSREIMKGSCGNMENENVIERTAKRFGVSVAVLYDKMQKAIDAAWDMKDELALKRQQELFPNGKPTVEEFIAKISKNASDKGNR